MKFHDYNLIPLAGAGSRFEKEGYTLPKPLIPVSGRPMIIQACESLPEAENWIFVCRKEHCEEYALEKTLSDRYPKNQIITIDYLTEGQASTCYLAENLMEDSSSLLVGPCDNGMIWNKSAYQELIEDKSVDALIWTFRNNPTVKRNPQMYGWVDIDPQGWVRNVSCKTSISDDPINDHAVVGTFYFRQSGQFKAAYKSMVEKNRRINNEFYMDVLMNELVEAGLGVKVFEIEKYICWGTPNDLKTYEYWENFFNTDP